MKKNSLQSAGILMKGTLRHCADYRGFGALRICCFGILLAVMISPAQAQEQPSTQEDQLTEQQKAAARPESPPLITAPQPKPDSVDPLQAVNRKIFVFNRVFDLLVTKPVALLYVKTTPQWLRDRIKSFYFNLEEITNTTNSLLQGKFDKASTASTRFMINSTFGIVGFFDIATQMGLVRHEEDFGQTLAVWGIGAGPYLELPFLGPSTLRDAFAFMPDRYLDPVRSISHIPTKNTIRGIELIDLRASYLPYDDMVSGDKYLFIRNAYLQTRDYAIADGKVKDDFLQDDFSDDF